MWLREIARRFVRELRDPRTDSARQAARIANRRPWPLLPNDFVSGDRSRIVRPLVERAGLSQAEADRRAERALLHDALTRTLGPAMVAETLAGARRRADAARRTAV